MSTIKLPFGIFEHSLNHISVVQKEEGRQYACPKCGGALIPRKGGERAHHFAHFDIKGCEGAAEYALRAKLMELIEETKTFALPVSTGFINSKEHVVIEEQSVQIDSVEVIDSPNPLQPRFEVNVSNQLGCEDKITVAINLGTRNISEADQSMVFVEIKLSDLDNDFSVERLRSVISGGTKCVKWVNRPQAVKAENDLRDKINYDRIRTNSEHADELLESARRPSFQQHSNAYQSYNDGGIRQQAQDKARPIPRAMTVLYTCNNCGRKDLHFKDMKRCKPDYGTGTCSFC